MFSKFALSVAQLGEDDVPVAGAFVALGGMGVLVRVAVDGMGVRVRVAVGKIGVEVRVAVGGIEVKVRVRVAVRETGVSDGDTVVAVGGGFVSMTRVGGITN